MTVETQMRTLEIIGGPAAGTVSALTIATDRQGQTLLYVGSAVGLYRATLTDNGHITDWQRMPLAPLGIMALTASPQFATDHLLIAGTDVGIFLSDDAGTTWRAAQTPSTPSTPTTVLALACSPNFTADGLLLAGTLEDGVWLSQDRGRTWEARNFGLFDSTVYGVAFSPNFAQDASAFIGTEGGLYQSYNGARAWKDVALPAEIAPVLSLALSPNFAVDAVMLVGIEGQGLFYSSDRGASWESAALPADNINVLAAVTNTFIAATNAGLFHSADAGATWQCMADISHALCFVAHGPMCIAGLNQDGLAIFDGADWALLDTPPMRAVSGLVLSPRFDQDGRAFLYGPSEGIWRTFDAGRTWQEVSADYPDGEIRALATVATAATVNDLPLIATSNSGVLLSQDNAASWQSIWDQPVQAAAASTRGCWIADESALLYQSSNTGAHWAREAVPWPPNSRVLALSAAEHDRVIAAAIEEPDAIAIWISANGDWHKALQHPLPATDLPQMQVRFWQTQATGLFVSIDQHLWQFGGDAWAVRDHVALTDGADDAEQIIALDGLRGRSDVVFACTHQRIWRWRVGAAPTLAHDFGDDRAVAFALSPSPSSLPSPKSAETGSGYAVLLGGRFAYWKGENND